MYTFMGYDNEEHVQSTWTRIEKQPAARKVNTMLTETRRIADHIAQDYGISVDGEDDDSPDKKSRSALFRLNQFLGVLNGAQRELGIYFIDTLQTSDLAIRFTIRVAPDKSKVFDLLQGRFERLDGFASFTRGDATNTAEHLKFKDCRLEFVRID